MLSIARVGAAPVLGYLAIRHAGVAFTILLIGALLTDIADGYIARRFGLTSKLGALLDSIADVLVFFVAVGGIWAFHPDLLRDHAIAGGLLVGCWILEIGASVIRFGRLSSFHTYLSKVAGFLLGVTIAVLFVGKLPIALMYTAVAVSVVAHCEELALIVLLPMWRTDVRGLLWILVERRSCSN